MNISIKPLNASRLINPGEVILISCAYKGRRNITTCAWHMPISKEPPILAVALAKKHFSTELIIKSKEFVINILDWSMLDKVMFCGSVSGRDVDKFKKLDLKEKPASFLKEAVKIKEAIANIECKVFYKKSIGDHFLILGRVVFAEADDRFFKDFWDTKKIDLIFHLGSNLFFKSSPYIEK